MTSTPFRGILVALALGGCALSSATGYEPAGSDGGYSELQLAPDIFRVAFQGNPYTSQERVADMALLRAADLALANGASYFVVLQQLRQSSSFPNPPLTPFPYTTYGYGYWGPPNPAIVVQNYRAELAIRLVRGQPESNVSAYSATLLREELNRRYALDRK